MSRPDDDEQPGESPASAPPASAPPASGPADPPPSDESELRSLGELVSRHAEETQVFSAPGLRALAAGASADRPYGVRGRPLREAPWRVAFSATWGAMLAAALGYAIYLTGSVITLIVVAMFIALGLDPAVTWLQKHGWRRGFGVAAVSLGLLGFLAAFLGTAVPAISREGRSFGHRVPAYLHSLQHRHDWIGDLARRVHTGTAGKVPGASIGLHGLVTTGRTVLTAVASLVTVIVLVVYFLANLPAIKRAAYRLYPRSRRARAGLLTDEVLRRAGGYLLGNILTSAVAGAAMIVFLLVLRVPDAIFLGLLVAVFDLIPLVGALAAGVIVALVALTVSLPVALATVAFTAVFRLLEDYLLAPRIMRRTVEVPPVVTVVAVLIGGALGGVAGALLAIPVAAGLDLVYREVWIPRSDAA